MRAQLIVVRPAYVLRVKHAQLADGTHGYLTRVRHAHTATLS